METIIKVIEDINKKFGNIVPFYSAPKSENPVILLNQYYAKLLKNNFDNFISFLKEYEFPKDFPEKFSFDLPWLFDTKHYPSGIEINGKKIHKLWEANIYASGKINNIRIIHSILYNNPDLFLTLFEKEIIERELKYYNYYFAEEMLYPNNDKAVKIFVNNFLWPSIEAMFEVNNIEGIIRFFCSWALNLKEDVFKEIYSKFKNNIEEKYKNPKKKLKLAFLCIIIYSLPIIKRKSDFLITLCQVINHNYTRNSIFLHNDPENIKNIEKIVSTFNTLPVEIILNDNIPDYLLMFAIGNKNLVNSAKFKKALNAALHRSEIVFGLTPKCVYVPENFIFDMAKTKLDNFMDIAFRYYGTGLVFPFKFIPEEKRNEIKNMFIVKKLIEKLLREYEKDNISDYDKALHIADIIEKGTRKKLNDEEIETLIEIFLEYSKEYNFAKNIRNLRGLKSIPYNRYINPLKKFLYGDKEKRTEQIMLFAA